MVLVFFVLVLAFVFRPAFRKNVTVSDSIYGKVFGSSDKALRFYIINESFEDITIYSDDAELDIRLMGVWFHAIKVPVGRIDVKELPRQVMSDAKEEFTILVGVYLLVPGEYRIIVPYTDSDEKKGTIAIECTIH